MPQPFEIFWVLPARKRKRAGKARQFDSVSKIKRVTGGYRLRRRLHKKAQRIK